MQTNTPEDGKVLYAAHGGVHILRYVGPVRYPLAPSVDRFVGQILESTPDAAFAIDLTQTSIIDSTNLGLLAKIANRVRAADGPRISIVSSRPDISQLLASMGFDEVFDIVENSSTPTPAGKQLQSDVPDRETLTQTVLETHRLLMELNDRNRVMFRDVVETLENGKSAKPES
jgi:anti-anti-sigma factor